MTTQGILKGNSKETETKFAQDFSSFISPYIEPCPYPPFVSSLISTLSEGIITTVQAVNTVLMVQEEPAKSFILKGVENEATESCAETINDLEALIRTAPCWNKVKKIGTKMLQEYKAKNPEKAEASNFMEESGFNSKPARDTQITKDTRDSAKTDFSIPQMATVDENQNKQFNSKLRENNFMTSESNFSSTSSNFMTSKNTSNIATPTAAIRKAENSQQKQYSPIVDIPADAFKTKTQPSKTSQPSERAPPQPGLSQKSSSGSHLPPKLTNQLFETTSDLYCMTLGSDLNSAAKQAGITLPTLFSDTEITFMGSSLRAKFDFKDSRLTIFNFQVGDIINYAKLGNYDIYGLLSGEIIFLLNSKVVYRTGPILKTTYTAGNQKAFVFSSKAFYSSCIPKRTLFYIDKTSQRLSSIDLDLVETAIVIPDSFKSNTLSQLISDCNVSDFCLDAGNSYCHTWALSPDGCVFCPQLSCSLTIKTQNLPPKDITFTSIAVLGHLVVTTGFTPSENTIVVRLLNLWALLDPEFQEDDSPEQALHRALKGKLLSLSGAQASRVLSNQSKLPAKISRSYPSMQDF